MTYKLNWLLENRVMYVYATGILEIEEFILMNESILEMIHQGLANGVPQVHFFIETHQVPKLAGPLEIGKNMSFLREKGIGQVVLGGIGNRVMPFMAKIIGNIAGIKISIFDTPEEALNLLMRKDHDLPDLMPYYRKLRNSFEV